jgi:hypothetical protein
VTVTFANGVSFYQNPTRLNVLCHYNNPSLWGLFITVVIGLKNSKGFDFIYSWKKKSREFFI